MNNSSAKSDFAIAQNEITQYLSKQADQIAPEKPFVKITQRKARLHDKNRTRRRDVQQWVFRRTGLSSTAQVKRYLLKLGQRRDLRLTAAWIDINLNYADAIAQLVNSEVQYLESAIAARALRGEDSPPQTSLESSRVRVSRREAFQDADSKFKVGDRVKRTECTARTAYAEVWSPFVILDIVDGEAVLDMLDFRVPLSQLQLAS